MPFFSDCCGVDEYICQVCGRVFCSLCHPSTWGVIIRPGHKPFNGNSCPNCAPKESGESGSLPTVEAV